ncbi:hypothetical protein M441DRAFT_44415 [Trichoderma asperellum CBS 433.97]|uniref:Uncharacterized protein n=1 Tax=Trichoderma asperellum (strain ATCC 204424 / CBS 433.97 / NBRC 101777) TaxID=1042311 RepID=A0A2T3ZHQ5_TRIA4|nr:hypothetical protein M441DRAFT_44415 [Trichoderma asperellum CBS 433.97]PTB44339.1 hypothetical protein M441DRAFT_44415 [Trichoderma asperellum CBS 433.97]
MAESDAFSQKQHQQKTESNTNRDPPSAFPGSSLRDAPRGPQSQQRAPFPGADPWSPGEQLRSAVEAPIPALGVDATHATAQLYQGGAAGQSHPPIVLRRPMTDGNASSELAISSFSVSGCLLQKQAPSSLALLPIISPNSCECLTPPSLFGYAALANIQPFRESQNAACPGFGT